jgi:hypothetical protein
VVDATLLTSFIGEPELTGVIRLNFQSVTLSAEIIDRYARTVAAQGVFVTTFYSVENDANSRIQPDGQVNGRLVLVDDRGRQWEAASYLSPGFDVSDSFAVQAGAKDPKAWVGPGFSNTTAVTFDIPEGTTGLKLVGETLGIEVDLGR